MTPQLKALLLGVSLRWTENPNGCGLIGDKARQQSLTEALERLTIEIERLEPDTLASMLPDAEDMLRWLASKPKARITLDFWSVLIESPEFSDVDHEQYDHPFELSGAVEDFEKTGSDGAWSCFWAIG